MNHEEHDFQKLVAGYLTSALPQDYPWTALDAGAFFGGGTKKLKNGKEIPLGAIRWRKMQERGVKIGWPDVQILRPMSITGYDNATLLRLIKYIGIECKRLKGGRLSDDQKKVRDQILAIGGSYYVCRTIEEVQECLLLEKIPLRCKLS